MHIADFSKWLRTLLRPELFKDYCPNGLCVEASPQVTQVVTGVSFREELIDFAIARKADGIVVHHPHGFWNNEARLPVGALGHKVRLLMRHGISLYGFHLPLDAHPELGNNALIAKAVGLDIVGSFMREGQADIGVMAACPGGWSSGQLESAFSAALGHPLLHALQHGPERVERVAICSGSGMSGLTEALSLGAQAFLTGEIKENTPIVAREENIHILAGGHHRTEVFGVRALAERIQSELGIPAAFLDVDNPV